MAHTLCGMHRTHIVCSLLARPERSWHQRRGATVVPTNANSEISGKWENIPAIMVFFFPSESFIMMCCCIRSWCEQWPAYLQFCRVMCSSLSRVYKRQEITRLCISCGFPRWVGGRDGKEDGCRDAWSSRLQGSGARISVGLCLNSLQVKSSDTFSPGTFFQKL